MEIMTTPIRKTFRVQETLQNPAYPIYRLLGVYINIGININNISSNNYTNISKKINSNININNNHNQPSTITTIMTTTTTTAAPPPTSAAATAAPSLQRIDATGTWSIGNAIKLDTNGIAILRIHIISKSIKKIIIIFITTATIPSKISRRSSVIKTRHNNNYYNNNYTATNNKNKNGNATHNDGTVPKGISNKRNGIKIDTNVPADIGNNDGTDMQTFEYRKYYKLR